MNPSKVDRKRMRVLTDLPNIGKALAEDLELLGIRQPSELIGRDPYRMHAELCAITGTRQDPCVIDVFLSITRFMDGGPSQPWWAYTAERKAATGGR